MRHPKLKLHAPGVQEPEVEEPPVVEAPVEEPVAEVAEGADTDQWVQCDRCRSWRIVPDEGWPSVQVIPIILCGGILLVVAMLR